MDKSRLALIFLAVLFVGLMALIIALTWLADTQTVDRLQDFVEYLDDHTDNQSKLILTLGALFAALLAFIVIIVEFLPSPVSDIELTADGKSKTVISGESVRDQLIHDLMAMPEVKEADAQVYGRRNGMEIAVDLNLSQNADVPATSDAARHVIEDVAQNRLNVPLLAPPVVKVHFAPRPAAPSPMTSNDESSEAQ